MSFFGTDETDALEAKIAELERDLTEEQRNHSKTSDELDFHKNLKYNHTNNVTRSNELAEERAAFEHEQELSQLEISNRTSKLEADFAAKKAVFEAECKARETELSRKEAALIQRDTELDDRADDIDSREGDINDSNYQKGYAAGNRAGLEQVNQYRADDRKHYGEIMKLHAVGQFMPRTVKEGDKDAMSELSGKLGAELIGKIMNGDTVAKKDK